MGDDLEQLKSVFRSLVVSSPTEVNVCTLLRDYRKMIGAPVPLTKYGYRNPVEFLQERFSDSFLFSGAPSNPVLTLIVPKKLQHIDKFVQKQKSSSVAKFNPKRRSVPEEYVKPQREKFDNVLQNTNIKSTVTSKKPHIKSNKIVSKPDETSTVPNIVPNILNVNGVIDRSISCEKTLKDKTQTISSAVEDNINVDNKPQNINCVKNNVNKDNTNKNENISIDNCNAVKNFLKKRLPLYDSSHFLDDEPNSSNKFDISVKDDDSGRHTSSSGNSSKARQLEQLKQEILQIISDAPEGIWCTDLIRLYRERYSRELNFTRFGYTSIISLVYSVEQHLYITRPVETGDWFLIERSRTSQAPPTLRIRRTIRTSRTTLDSSRILDPEDALPGIDFDPDVFPEDCMHYMESIECVSLSEFRPGAMVEVIIGEVYSPSHFWFIRVGENYNIAMEDMMDEMTSYYNKEGRDRVLSRGAVRVGHYCSSLYERDWHRSLIVKIIDSDTVKVRHIDYGTVDTVPVCALRPLRRVWSTLPAQASRARLAAVRPPAAGWRWPHASCAAFLALVTNKRLVANVVALDTRENIAEVLLIDTSSDDDVCIGTELIRGGHADSRPDSALRTRDAYLYPRFEALESGATPNYAEVRAYLRDGIALDYVDEYRAHVPHVLHDAAPSPPPPTASPPPPPAPSESVSHPELTTRVPLLLPDRPAPPKSAPTLSEPEPTDKPVRRSPLLPTPPDRPVRRSPLLPTPPAGASHLSPHAAAYVPRPQQAERSPPPPYGPATPACPAGVTLSLAECETYRVLSHVNPAAAHWFMIGAMGRAMSEPLVPPVTQHHVPYNPYPPPPPPHMVMPRPYFPQQNMPFTPPAHMPIRPPPGFGY